MVPVLEHKMEQMSKMVRCNLVELVCMKVQQVRSLMEQVHNLEQARAVKINLEISFGFFNFGIIYFVAWSSWSMIRRCAM
jgi:hypothetical protein